MMALMSAQHRFALTAFSPLFVQHRADPVMIALLGLAADPADAATIIAATVGIAGLLQLVILLLRRGAAALQRRCAFHSTPACAAFRQGHPGMIAGSGPQLLVVGGAIIASSSPSAVSCCISPPPDRTAARLVGAAMGTVLGPN